MNSVRVVELHTSEGVLCVELYDAEAPIVAESFCRLAVSGQLNGPLFRSVIAGYAVVAVVEEDFPLGVLWDGRDVENSTTALSVSSPPLNSRSSVLRHVGAGLLSCPRLGGGVPCASFIITLSPQPKLDNDYIVFGRVFSGMSVLERIGRMQVNEQFSLYTVITVSRCVVVQLPRLPRPFPLLHDTAPAEEGLSGKRVHHRKRSVLTLLE